MIRSPLMSCFASVLLLAGACAPSLHATSENTGLQPTPTTGALPLIASPANVSRPPFDFSPSDEVFLDEVQRSCFLFFWHEVSPRTGMVVDRTSDTIVSVAGVGFQLSGLPIGVERGWVSREQAADRARLILSSLLQNPHNRRDGLFYHYLDPSDAGPHRGGHEHVISTIDSAILLAGVATAGEYFGGEIKQSAKKILRDADWRAFVLQKSTRAYESNFISLGYRPRDPQRPNDGGELLPYVWADAGDEQRLVTFLAVAAPDPDDAVNPDMYYRMRRRLGSFKDTGPFVWFPWSGALFTHTFAHCWINYSALPPDNPAAFGVKHRASVDWWENSRRATRMHQLKAAENPRSLRGLGENAWGLTASDAPTGYAVPGLFPDSIPMPGAVPNFDYAEHTVTDDYGDGTIAPYGAGSAIMFDPARAVAALRHYQELKGPDGKPLVWREPDPSARQYGFLDAYNAGKNWVATDYVAIDQGPLLLAIENARTGLVWKLFGQSEVAKLGRERLKLTKPGSSLPSRP